MNLLSDERIQGADVGCQLSVHCLEVVFLQLTKARSRRITILVLIACEPFFSLHEVRESVAVGLVDIGLIGAKFKVRLLRVVVHQVMLLGDRPEIFTLTAQCGWLPWAVSDPQSALGKVH